MTEARNTDGSNRVTSAKNAITVTVATNRGRNVRRLRSGPASVRTNATFSPDTARRCVRPDPRKSSVTSAVCPRVSPSTNPRNSGRCRSGRDRGAALQRRPYGVRRPSGPPSIGPARDCLDLEPSGDVTNPQPVAPGGRSPHASADRDPLSRGARARNAAAVAGPAVASRCWPLASRTSARNAPAHGGRRIAEQCHGAGERPRCQGSQARFRRAPLAHRRARRLRRPAPAAIGWRAQPARARSPIHGDAPHSSHAPAAAASARPRPPCDQTPEPPRRGRFHVRGKVRSRGAQNIAKGCDNEFGIRGTSGRSGTSIGPSTRTGGCSCAFEWRSPPLSEPS